MVLVEREEQKSVMVSPTDTSCPILPVNQMPSSVGEGKKCHFWTLAEINCSERRKVTKKKITNLGEKQEYLLCPALQLEESMSEMCPEIQKHSA